MLQVVIVRTGGEMGIVMVMTAFLFVEKGTPGFTSGKKGK